MTKDSRLICSMCEKRIAEHFKYKRQYCQLCWDDGDNWTKTEKIQMKEEVKTKLEETHEKATRAEILEQIRHQIKVLEDLPQGAMMMPASNYDIFSLYCLILAVASLDES